jgi:hypothetical protein
MEAYQGLFVWGVCNVPEILVMDPSMWLLMGKTKQNGGFSPNLVSQYE